MKKYIIIGPGRSGTTVTHLILKGHPQVSALNDEVKIMELFGKGISAFTFGNDLEDETTKGFKKAYDLLALLNSGSETKVAGIKCAVGSVETAKVFVKRIKMSFPDINIILTVREDILAQYGSRIRAKKTGLYHSWGNGKVKKPLNITIEKGMYSDYLLFNIKIIEILRSLKQTNRFLEISYEKDILPSLNYYNKLYEFLELDQIEPTWVNSKKVAPSPREFITNYDKLKVIEKTIIENQQPFFTLRYSFYTFLKFVYKKIIKLIMRTT